MRMNLILFLSSFDLSHTTSISGCTTVFTFSSSSSPSGNLTSKGALNTSQFLPARKRYISPLHCRGFHKNTPTVKNWFGCSPRARPIYSTAPWQPGISLCYASSSERSSLLWGSCSSGRGFASSFLQIPPRGGHPCLRLAG